MDRIDISDVQECVERSVQLLHRTFRSSPTGGGGWYHNLDVGLPGPSATSVGLACMALIARTDNHVAEALEFLSARQIASTDPLVDGGWAVNTSGGIPVTECTALVGWMLGGARSFLAAGGPDLGRALEWLVRNQNSKILRDRPDVFLTTPESIEAMLVSAHVDHRSFFSGVSAVVVDEVHAFAGDDRGWHLLAVLERLERVAGRRLQRIGLSATVGNPSELLNWLQVSSKVWQPKRSENGLEARS